jgi:4-phospho-D-threonate 3-dehydrogenase / 4-phospho-D-erythronate 3-dehydrogenase
MKPLLAITLGDPAGIGPEIVAKALSSPQVYAVCHPVIVGDSSILRMGANVAKVRVEIDNALSRIITPYGISELVDLENINLGELVMGKSQAMGGKASVEYVIKAADLALKGKVEGIVTAPLSKEAMHMAGFNYPGHTELLAELAGVKESTMMLVSGDFRVVHVTTHVSLRKVSDLITKELVYSKIRMANEALISLGIDNPRIAVAGLNPHSGEGGLFGREEMDEIAPAIEEARKQGLTVEGPIPPDTVFGKASGGAYDVVVAMYHDQGHIPVKLMGFKYGSAGWEEMGGVNVTLGLPFIRTSVDHGTAYGKAGRREGTANPQSLIDAIKLAAKMAERRRTL